ncbi:hypothetical protein SAMN04488523_111104 [Sulfitobacter brevis]|uniref:Uncharacterized protein n=1 Tax=Sulfitobacter brevis TaxID=74348 RepID=A0A1I2E523_9RHOB|nr:hypothetical protein SAMN04488523_111104 [Sulfitobacter brevis]
MFCGVPVVPRRSDLAIVFARCVMSAMLTSMRKLKAIGKAPN